MEILSPGPKEHIVVRKNVMALLEGWRKGNLSLTCHRFCRSCGKQEAALSVWVAHKKKAMLWLAVV